MHRHGLKLRSGRRRGVLAIVAAIALIAVHVAGAYVLVLFAS